MSEPSNPNDGTLNRNLGSQERLAQAITPRKLSDTSDLPSLPQRIGRYEIKSLLGAGAFGRVYLAVDPGLDRDVAIKMPKADGLTPEECERFLREAKATAKIHHPNVCPVHDVGIEGGLPYIVMRYVPGGTLADHLKSLPELPPPQFAIKIVGLLAKGLEAAHALGVIHRDLKPANVLYSAATGEVLITDFGLARVGFNANVSSASAGTPLYMSPEQARGRAS